jgi:D-amino peptidase
MKILIMTDLEGISGVDTIEKVSDVGTPGHRFALERLMLDLNSAVDGAYEGGATLVYVVDGHGGGNNFLTEMLDPRAVHLKDSESWQKVVTDGEIDAYMQIGAHAMAGTINGFLDHTQSSKSWFNYIVNGRKSGEIAQGAIFVGAFDVPCIMVSGDEAACVEAKAFLGGIECAVVKYGVGRNKAKLVDLDEALKRIKAAARDSLKLVDKIKPYKPLLPMEIKLELYRSDMCDALMERCKDIERLDARTVLKLVYKVEGYRDILF